MEDNNKRIRKKENKEDLLIIAYDESEYDETILMVSKLRHNELTEIVNMFRNKEAEDLYDKLTRRR